MMKSRRIDDLHGLADGGVACCGPLVDVLPGQARAHLGQELRRAKRRRTAARPRASAVGPRRRAARGRSRPPAGRERPGAAAQEAAAAGQGLGHQQAGHDEDAGGTRGPGPARTTQATMRRRQETPPAARCRDRAAGAGRRAGSRRPTEATETQDRAPGRRRRRAPADARPRRIDAPGIGAPALSAGADRAPTWPRSPTPPRRAGARCCAPA